MSTLPSQAARTFRTGRRVGFEGFGRRLAPSSSVRSKNWMISRQGSHLNMLRDAAAFDIAFRQPGQSGFIEVLEIEDLEMEVLEMEVLEIEVLEIEVLEIEVMETLCCVNILDARTIPVRTSRNTTNQGCFFWLRRTVLIPIP
jgi:hypothetical protein